MVLTNSGQAYSCYARIPGFSFIFRKGPNVVARLLRYSRKRVPNILPRVRTDLDRVRINIGENEAQSGQFRAASTTVEARRAKKKAAVERAQGSGARKGPGSGDGPGASAGNDSVATAAGSGDESGDDSGGTGDHSCFF